MILLTAPARTAREGRIVRLRNGATVAVRSMHRTDAERLVRFHRSLSPETIRWRFFTFHPELSPAEVEWFTHVDHEDREAIVATDGDDIVGVARWDRPPGGDRAEIAFVVTDAWQGVGLGQALFQELVDRARAAGIRLLTAETLPGNRPMLGVFRHGSDAMRSHYGDGVIEVEIPLD